MTVKNYELPNEHTDSLKDENTIYKNLTKLMEIDLVYLNTIEKYEAEYPLYNDIDLYANIYRLRKEKERIDNESNSLSTSKYKTINSSYNKILKRKYNNNKITIDALVELVDKRILNAIDIRFLVNSYGLRVNLFFDHEYIASEIEKIVKNLSNLYLALKEEVFSSKEIYYKMISVINARTKYKDKKHYLLAVINRNTNNNHKAIISFIDNDECSLLSSLLTKHNLGDLYDYDDHQILNNKEELKVIYHLSFKESIVADTLYSIINSALLNSLDTKAYLTYLFNEFKDKAMEETIKYLPWNEEIQKRFKKG